MTGTLVLKLVDTNYLKSFLKYGELHFGTTSLYKKIEVENGNVGIGDKNEGEYSPKLVYKGGYPSKALAGLPKRVSFQYPANIFCVTQLHMGVETADIIKYDVIRNLYESLMNDTDYPKTIVGFRDFNEVSKRIKNRIGKFNSSAPIMNIESPVHYVKYENIAEEAQMISAREFPHIPTGLGSTLAVNIVKDEKFKGEYEYRFVMFPSVGGSKILKNHHNNVQIGNLENQAIVIGSLKDLVRTVRVALNKRK